MILDEAIKCTEKLAKEFKLDVEISITKYAKENLNRLADEYEQLASWLKELKEAKRLLKMAVEDISTMPCNNDTHRPDSCCICEKHGNCSYTDSFKWCKADIALKLIGDEPNK